MTVDGERVSEIGRGYLLLVGVGRGDAADEPERLAEKIVNLRLFADDEGKTNLPLAGVDGEVLVVSQFTLYADLRKGRRPSWGDAEEPRSRPTGRGARAALEARGARGRGVFGAMMDVELLNDGPFTLVLEARPSARRRAPSPLGSTAQACSPRRGQRVPVASHPSVEAIGRARERLARIATGLRRAGAEPAGPSPRRLSTAARRA